MKFYDQTVDVTQSITTVDDHFGFGAFNVELYEVKLASGKIICEPNGFDIALFGARRKRRELLDCIMFKHDSIGICTFREKA